MVEARVLDNLSKRAVGPCLGIVRAINQVINSALYQRPSSIDAMVTDTAQHALQLLGLPNVPRTEWQGLRSN